MGARWRGGRFETGEWPRVTHLVKVSEWPPPLPFASAVSSSMVAADEWTNGSIATVDDGGRCSDSLVGRRICG